MYYVINDRNEFEGLYGKGSQGPVFNAEGLVEVETGEDGLGSRMSFQPCDQASKHGVHYAHQLLHGKIIQLQSTSLLYIRTGNNQRDYDNRTNTNHRYYKIVIRKFTCVIFH